MNIDVQQWLAGELDLQLKEINTIRGKVHMFIQTTIALQGVVNQSSIESCIAEWLGVKYGIDIQSRTVLIGNRAIIQHSVTRNGKNMHGEPYNTRSEAFLAIIKGLYEEHQAIGMSRHKSERSMA